MPETRMAVSTADVSRMALDRLATSLDELKAGVLKQAKHIMALEDEFRHLLSYCEDQAQHSGYALEQSAYLDIADKLRSLLDGE